MPIFEYEATDGSGKTIRGTIFGPDPTRATQNLLTRGYQVQRLQAAVNPGDPLAQPVQQQQAPQAPIHQGPIEGIAAPTNGIPEDVRHRQAPTTKTRDPFSRYFLGPLVGKVPQNELLFFFQQTATLIDAGIGNASAMESMSRQSRSPNMRNYARDFMLDAEKGIPLSEGFRRYPEVFSPVMVALTKAGEEGGYLPEALKEIASYLERDIEIRRMVRRATFMPKATLVMSIIIVIVVNAIIKMVAPGSPFGLWSPLTEPATWLWLGPLLVGIWVFMRFFRPLPGIQALFDTIGANLPYIGRTNRGFAVARFGRAFGTLYKGGVLAPKALVVAAEASGNKYLQSRIAPAANKIAGGYGMADSLRETGVLDSTVIDMIATGERTGNLDQMLTKMAEFYEAESDVRAKQQAHVLGILVLIAVAIYVFFMVASFYMGYFTAALNAGEKLAE